MDKVDAAISFPLWYNYPNTDRDNSHSIISQAIRTPCFQDGNKGHSRVTCNRGPTVLTSLEQENFHREVLPSSSMPKPIS